MTRIAWICCILTMIVLPSPGIAKQPAQVQLTTIFTYTRDAAPGIREIGINFDGAESVLYSSQFGAEDMEITPDGQNLVGGFFNGEVILIPLDGSQPTVLYQVSNGFIQGIGTTDEDVNVAFTDGSDPVVINVKFNDPGNAVVVADASTGLTGHPQDTDVFVFNGMTYDATATETKVHIRVHGSTGPDAAQIDLSNGAVKAKVVDGNLWFTDQNFSGDLWSGQIGDINGNTGLTEWDESPTVVLMLQESSNIKSFDLAGDEVFLKVEDQLKRYDGITLAPLSSVTVGFNIGLSAVDADLTPTKIPVPFEHILVYQSDAIGGGEDTNMRLNGSEFFLTNYPGSAVDLETSSDATFVVVAYDDGKVFSISIPGGNDTQIFDTGGAPITGLAVANRSAIVVYNENDTPTFAHIDLNIHSQQYLNPRGWHSTDGIDPDPNYDAQSVNLCGIRYDIVFSGNFFRIYGVGEWDEAPPLIAEIEMPVGVVNFTVDLATGKVYYTDDSEEDKIWEGVLFTKGPDPQDNEHEIVTWNDHTEGFDRSVAFDLPGVQINTLVAYHGSLYFDDDGQIIEVDLESGFITARETVDNAVAFHLSNIEPPDPEVVLSVNEVYAHPGHQTSVTLTAQNEVPVAGFEFKVQSVDSESSPLAPIALEDEQPSSHVQPEGAINHLESDGFSVFETTDEAGVSTFIVVAIGGDTIEPGEHTVLELVYTVAEESEALDLPHVIDVVMTDVVVSSPDAQSILTSVQNGSITIGVQGDVSGGEFGTGDGEINVLDIVQVINYILEVVPLPEDPFSLWVLDMNDDGDINVLDLQLLINSFLGIEPVVTRPMVATPSVATLQSEPTTDQAHPFVLIDLDLSEDIAGFQAVLQFDPKSIQPGVPTLDESVSGLQLNYAVKDGRLSLLVYSLDGGQIDSGIDGLVRVPVTVVGGEGEIRLSEMILSNAAGQAIPSRISETTLKLADVPSEFALGPNAPNPFNPQTSISYEVPVQTRVLLVVYNLLGQEVTRLVDQIQPAGRYSVVWDARNGQGVQVASGVYMYRLITDSGRTESRRMMLLK